MLVKVTMTDINLGARNQCTTCPVARALSRLYPGSTAWVYRRFATIFDLNNKPLYNLDLPIQVSSWIKRFDQGRKVGPFEFSIDPSNTIRY